MIWLISIILFCLTCFLFILSNKQNGDKKNALPPGPIAFPLIGNVLQIGVLPERQFLKWSKIYGPIFRVKLGTDKAVVISDHKLLKELFTDSVSAGRFHENPIMKAYSKGQYGIINSHGSAWDQQRRFTFHTLKSFGFAKSSMEAAIAEEAQILVRWLKQRSDTPIQASGLFMASVVNSLWQMVAGERCDWENDPSETVEIFLEMFDSVTEVMSKGVYFLPVMRQIFPEWTGWNRFLKGIDRAWKLLEDSVAHHKENFDPNNLRDFMDCQLAEIDKQKENPDSSFYKKTGHMNMIVTLLDLFGAGSETAANTLAFFLLYISEHTHIQSKIHNEIDTILGSNPASLSIRSKMPYTEALIQELLRVTSIAPLALPHQMLEDKMFHGYYLPKGMFIFGNIYGIHHDPEIWGDPENFRPERFLSDDGSRCERHEALIPFSEGKRKCLGEVMAKDTLFLFIVSILQEFTIIPVDTKEKVDFVPLPAVVQKPKPFKVVFSSRKK